MKRFYLRSLMILFVIVLLAVSSGTAFGAVTNKQLSTNFTLVNLEDTEANVQVRFVREDGTDWPVGIAKSFKINPDGGQTQLRQYFDTTMTGGRGSAVISSDRQLGAVVQLLARNQTPTSGAYAGVTEGSAVNYIPILQKNNNTASGLARSEIIIQNAGDVAIDVEVDLYTSGSSTPAHTEPFNDIPAGSSRFYDLTTETSLPAQNWVGSAVVRVVGSGLVTTVSNLFLGVDGLYTFNGFPQESLTNEWYIPQVTSRLVNGQSSSISIQNLNGATIPANDIQLTCQKDPASSSTRNTISASNPSQIPDQGAYTFNPVTDQVNFPTDWYGSCKLSSQSGAGFVAVVQVRYTNGKAEAAAYEAIPANSTDTTAYVPLIMRRIANGGSTVVVVQNLDGSQATDVTLTYTPSATEYAGSQTPIVVGPLTIPSGGSIIRNHRLPAGFANVESALPDGWVGTLKIESDGAPIHAYVQLTNLNPVGDQYMAHLAFTAPAVK